MTKHPRANGFLLALQFLTVIPVQFKTARTSVSGQPDQPGAALDMGRSLPWFPLVGALLGAGVAALNWALEPIFSRSLRDVITIATLLLITGMLHFDGFVDCCDALLGARSVERRLDILRDSRVGAYGVGGGALLLLARYVTLESLSPGLWGLAVIAAIITGRWAMVWLVTLFPYVRARGAGSGFRASGVRLIGASGMALALLAALVAFAPQGTLTQRALILATLGVSGLTVALLWGLWASRRLGGGLTGDTYGAANELVEVAILALAPVVAQLVSSMI
ncbi:MAG TPA: adenosylcobinamide-GDP ribazoletransferase [Ktedonobacterales bacterium]|nr:adenosylcobinamide-GDP ribazoletransferase [Ktedonobacterales bacterium]